MGFNCDITRTQFTDYLSLAPNRVEKREEIVNLAVALGQRYFEPIRHYHDLMHIIQGYREHEKFVGHMGPVTFFAWTYHDAIYDPQAKDNEEQSARLFEKDNAVLGFSDADVRCIMALIRSTTHMEEKNIITDIDLSNLAIPADEYDKNTQKIRTEYAHLDDAAWYAGRRAFLIRFLAAVPVFDSPRFASAYERRAVENMEQELSRIP